MECPFRTYFEPIVCGSHFPNARHCDEYGRCADSERTAGKVP